MRFALNEHQKLLSSEMHRWCEQELPLETLQKHVAERKIGTKRQDLAQMGAFGVCSATDDGGSGLGTLEAALVAQALGYHCFPLNLHAQLTVVKILDKYLQGSDNTELDALRRQIINGEHGVVLAWDGPRRDGSGVTYDSKSQSLSGTLLAAAGDKDASILAVIGRDGIYLVNRMASVQQTAMPSIDQTRPQWQVTLQDADAVVVGAEAITSSEVLSFARLLLAADSIGAQQKMLARAVEYAGEREQFGRVIASFQAVKHMCAEMTSAIEPNVAFLWYTGYCCDERPQEFQLMASHLKADVDDTGLMVAKTATEVHGGMGFTDLLGLHLFFKRIGQSRQWLGSADSLRIEAADLQGY